MFGVQIDPRQGSSVGQSRTGMGELKEVPVTQWHVRSRKQVLGPKTESAT